MSGRILVRTGEGLLQEFPLAGSLRIGSAPPSELVLEGDGVLPQHAVAVISDQGCFIEAVGSSSIAINGERVERRALRHLDVITLGDRVHVIFSTSTVPLPQQQQVRAKKPVTAVVSPANVTRALTRADVAAATFRPQVEALPASAPNTTVGLPAAPAFPASPSPANTIVGLPPVATAPPAFGAQSPQTIEVSPGAARSFKAPETVMFDAPVVRPINSVRFSGVAGVFEAPLGTSLVGRGSKATLRIDSSQVSRVHAMVIASPDRVTIEDQNTVNGTAVNGVPTKGPHVLAEGDLVSFGTIDLRVDFVRLGGG